MIGAIHSNVHGTATYIKTNLSNCYTTYTDCMNNVHVLATEINGFNIVNVYKPPSKNWSNDILKVFPHPVIYIGDFNSHNQMWGYEHNNIDGNRLLEWMILHKIYI